MKIAPKAGPSVIKVNTANTSSYRDAAIAALSASMSGNAAPTPPQPTSPSDLVNTSTISSSSVEPSVQQGNNEATQTTAPAESKPADSKESISSQYAILARKEKALRAQVQKLNAEREAFKQQQSTVKSSSEIDTSKYISADKIKEDPFSVLNDLGISYEQLTNQALNQPSSEELQIRRTNTELRSEIEKLSKRMEDMQKNSEESEKLQMESAVSQIRREVKQLVSSDESFEAIKTAGESEKVVELITKNFDETGELLSVEEAARLIEDELVERALRFSKLNKIQNRLKAANPSAPKPETKPAADNQLKTLTNSLASSRPLTARDRAILAMRGELK